ncbi:hypothetical protein IF1G_03511 [Cordyceps javanica]|uniref:Uncharacterized protein n=1 Tax=Cordyceps javanica TaxID=43265 RepID=A0A545V7U1_9HYPO|nr:hypothetical protein IF1G_03511 [Cordyceps javanica]
MTHARQGRKRCFNSGCKHRVCTKCLAHRSLVAENGVSANWPSQECHEYTPTAR